METVIETEKLTKRFGAFVACNELSFTVGKGEIFGFLGANGAGKTTAMRMLCGFLGPSAENASIAGFDVYTQTEKLQHHIRHMSQKSPLYHHIPLHPTLRLYAHT